MIAWCDVEIGVHAKEPGSTLDDNAGLFLDFAENGLDKRLAPLDATARKMPAGPISVPHHQDFIAISYN